MEILLLKLTVLTGGLAVYWTAGTFSLTDDTVPLSAQQA
jgi:hypothetical protein